MRERGALRAALAQVVTREVEDLGGPAGHRERDEEALERVVRDRVARLAAHGRALAHHARRRLLDLEPEPQAGVLVVRVDDEPVHPAGRRGLEPDVADGEARREPGAPAAARETRRPQPARRLLRHDRHQHLAVDGVADRLQARDLAEGVEAGVVERAQVLAPVRDARQACLVVEREHERDAAGAQVDRTGSAARLGRGERGVGRARGGVAAAL
ncbi:hypothetical protein GCM10025864_30080 [Luteimicrobium album]|uniref:Uncharacterized protein n=1 Tax=Luteimicrobium album TaxID=1054550 RepID=A0ABQ6I637_9MICO|nr:hypothetical protein GCM10025864_30080 [Luteimicrobium album]